MKYGFVFPGDDVALAVTYAQLAEAVGWDGYFVWDAVWGVDPWVTLAAIAATTERIRIGTMITPVSRRRPWKLASETATLDRLSGGRLILAVGLGALDTGFYKFGEQTDRKVRAELLDEGLDIVTGLWRGLPFAYEGKHYTVLERDLHITCPPPIQSPRIPIWVVGAWPRKISMRRVVRYDGLLPNKLNDAGEHEEVEPNDIKAMKAFVEEHRIQATPFDIVVEGRTPGDDRAAAVAMVEPWCEAGATWWIDQLWGVSDMERVRTRITQGPPRLV